MHGMINRGLQCYICDVHGTDLWEDVCDRSKLPFYNFETMLSYDDATTESVLASFQKLVNRSREEILEDFGTYIVSDTSFSAVRRLLKFGGETYSEFLESLNFVHDRAQIAVPNLDIPQIEAISHTSSKFILYAWFKQKGFGTTLLGLLRALADDYGSLVMINHSMHLEKGKEKNTYNIDIIHNEWQAVYSPELVQK